MHVEQVLLGDPLLVDHLHDLVLDLHLANLHLLLVVPVQVLGYSGLLLLRVVVSRIELALRFQVSVVLCHLFSSLLEDAVLGREVLRDVLGALEVRILVLLVSGVEPRVAHLEPALLLALALGLLDELRGDYFELLVLLLDEGNGVLLLRRLGFECLFTDVRPHASSGVRKSLLDHLEVVLGL